MHRFKISFTMGYTLDPCEIITGIIVYRVFNLCLLFRLEHFETALNHNGGLLNFRVSEVDINFLLFLFPLILVLYHLIRERACSSNNSGSVILVCRVLRAYQIIDIIEIRCKQLPLQYTLSNINV